MGIKKKNKVSAQFNMSSLTDIIFLLLIFFMLTSSLIIPNALNLQLPGKNSPPPPVPTEPASISIERNGTYYFNGKRINFKGLESQMLKIKKAKKDKAVVQISPHAKASNDAVVAVLDIAYRYGIKTALSEPKG